MESQRNIPLMNRHIVQQQQHEQQQQQGASQNHISSATGSHHQQIQNRLQNSMRMLMKHASDFQQQQQQQSCTSSSNNNSNTTTTEATGTNDMMTTPENSAVSDPSNQHHILMKQAGSVLQQKIRGIRRRVKSSVQSMQQQQHAVSNNDESGSISNSHSLDEDEIVEVSCSNTAFRQQKRETSYIPRIKTKRIPPSIVSPSSYDDDGNNTDCTTTLDVAKLTPKKKSLHSPLPQKTVKIPLQEEQQIILKQKEQQSQPESFPEALGMWFDSCHQLVTGPDMNRFIRTTGSVYYHGATLCLRTVTLPITLPIHVGLVTCQSITNVVVQNTAPLLLQQPSGQGSEESHHHHSDGLFGSILSIPGTVLGITGKIVISVIAPVLGMNGNDTGSSSNSKTVIDDKQLQKRKRGSSLHQSTGSSSSPEEKERAVLYAKTPSKDPNHKDDSNSYLDRLRLDYIPPSTNQKEIEFNNERLPRRMLFNSDDMTSHTVVVQQTKFLLRVNDWRISRPTDDSDLYYIDIGPAAIKETINQELISLALDRFVESAISLLENHPICKLTNCKSIIDRQHTIQWHPEGATKRILRDAEQSLNSKTNPYKDEILIWSGRFQHDIEKGYGRKHNFFLARGCIGMSPKNFVKLLWDNTRTSEYNNFCLGRSTLHGLSSVTVSSTDTDDDDRSFLDGSRETCSKVIQSEMRVPFAGITVKAVCLMHVRPLSSHDGYIICSRSLDVGPPGIHTTNNLLQQMNDGVQTITPAKHEILWGVNIIQSIPNDPNGTQLTSLSQVGSGVPSFLAQKIGLMGIGDFFKNVRQVAEKI